MRGIDRSPTRTGSVVAVAAALVALAASGLYSWIALAAGATGVSLVALGVVLGRHDAVTVGSGALFAGVLAAGVQGAPVGVVLLAAVTTVLAWDAGGTAIDLGAQVGRDAATARLELVHATATTAVGALTAGLAWSVYRIGVGGRSLTVPVLLLVSAFCIALALTIRGDSR